MMGIARHSDDMAPRLPRLRSAGPLATAVLAAVLLGTACAGGAGSSSPPASPLGDPRRDALVYSKCMRDHGMSDFPDPDASGGINIQGEPGGTLDPNSPQFKAADEACKSLLGPPPSEEQQEQGRAEMLEYAECMREHGFPTFPDPEPNGSVSVDAGEHPELDPSNPQFQEANEECGGPSEADTNMEEIGGRG